MLRLCLFQLEFHRFQDLLKFQLKLSLIDVFLSLISYSLCSDLLQQGHNVLDQRNAHLKDFLSCRLSWVHPDVNARKYLSSLLLYVNHSHFYVNLFRWCYVMIRYLQKFQKSYHPNQNLTHELTLSMESYGYGQYVHKKYLCYLFPFLTMRHG